MSVEACFSLPHSSRPVLLLHSFLPSFLCFLLLFSSSPLLHSFSPVPFPLSLSRSFRSVWGCLCFLSFSKPHSSFFLVPPSFSLTSLCSHRSQQAKMVSFCICVSHLGFGSPFFSFLFFCFFVCCLFGGCDGWYFGGAFATP